MQRLTYTNILVLIVVGKGRDETEASALTTLPSTQASSIRRPWAGGVRVRGIGALIYADLRAELVSLERLPGEPISEAELATAYGFSRTPVREAVRKLADEGLIEIFPQSGTFAARIPLGALPETIVIRKALEETSARLAAERAQRSQIIALFAQLERQREAGRAGDRGAFHQADEAFHGAIAEAAGYPGIWTLVEQVKVHVDRYRRLTLPQEGRMARAIREHAAIAAAIESGDGARAAGAMGIHLDGLLADIPDIRRLNPDYFADDSPAREPPVNGRRTRPRLKKSKREESHAETGERRC
jgi:GntR family transcriptional regulator, rspAB operon transcriptional repressor